MVLDVFYAKHAYGHFYVLETIAKVPTTRKVWCSSLRYFTMQP